MAKTWDDFPFTSIGLILRRRRLLFAFLLFIWKEKTERIYNLRKKPIAKTSSTVKLSVEEWYLLRKNLRIASLLYSVIGGMHEFQ